MTKLHRLVPYFSMASLLGVCAVYVVLVYLCGGNVFGAVLYPLAFVLLVVLPGMWLADLCLKSASMAEKAVIAVPTGSIMLCLSFVSIARFLPVYFAMIPCVGIGLWWLVKNRKLMRLPKISEISHGVWWLLILFSAALFLHFFAGMLPMAKAEAAGNMVYDQDMLWSIGNTSAVRYGAPLIDLHADGGVLHYHYLTDVVSGMVAVLSQQTAWDALAYFGWPIWAALMLLSVYLVVRRFGAGVYASLIAPAGAAFCHFAWYISENHIFTNVNGVLQNYGMMAAALLVVQIVEKEGFKNKRSLVVISAVIFALCFSKSMMGLLFVCASFAAVVVGGILKKQINKWLILAAVLGALSFLVLYVLIYQNAINNMILAPSVHKLQDAASILFSRYWPGTLLYVVSLFFTLREFKSLSYTALMVNAVVPGGVLAFVIYDHYAFSQSYFMLAAVFFMWLCIGRVAAKIFAKKLWGILAVTVCAVGCVFSVIYEMPTYRKGVQILLRCADLRPQYEWNVETITQDDAAAAAYLKENMDVNEVFATNRNDRNPDAPGGLFHYYTAASDRKAYVEGWRCAMDYSMDYHQLRHNLEVVSDGIFGYSDWQTAQKTAQENGIDYLLMYLPKGAQPYEGAQPVFESDTVLIYEVG